MKLSIVQRVVYFVQYQVSQVCSANAMSVVLTESKIEAQTSAATQRTKIGSDVTLWCNATGYPKPVVYWTREDRNRRLPDGTYQFWVSYYTFCV